ncbi:MAG TPA: hypothetical protein VHR37_08265, partial [Solirubrobacterales bacterium]|nr:hypothetical protein [Solirubrobacterales bacterium]
MKSEAGSRPLHARLAPTGTPREHASAAASNGSSGSSGSHGSNGEHRGGARRPTASRSKRTANAGKTSANGAAGKSTPLIHDDPLSALLSEAQAAVSEGANSLRDVRERYRAAYIERVQRWEGLRANTS